MENAQPSLFTRDDTFLGVCEGLGQDFGFNPLYLRIALPLLLFFNPVATIVGYLAAGVVVALSRWIFPRARQAVDTDVEAAEADGNEDRELLPLAA